MQREADSNLEILSSFEDTLYDLELKLYDLYEENDNLKKQLEEND